MRDDIRESKPYRPNQPRPTPDCHRAWPPHVVRRVQARIGSRLARHIDAEDALQDTWIALHHIHGGAPPSEIDAALVLRGCKRRLLEIARYHSRRDGSPTNDAPTTLHLDELPAPHAPEHELDVLEERIVVRRHLMQLRLDHRKVLMLRHWFDTPWERIALALHRPTTHAAHTLHTRALRALGTKLERVVRLVRPTRERSW